MLWSLDTETTGVDLWHTARPFFVTMCNEKGTQLWWEWSVDPKTREPQPPQDDLDEISGLVMGAERLVLQNSKFDVTALAWFIPEFREDWPWDRTDDTLLMAHLLASNQPKNLTALALMYLGMDIQPYEDRMQKACEESRRYCRSRLPEWTIAKEGTPGMPSVKSGSKRSEDKPWKNDTWLPKTLRRLGHFKERPDFDNVTAAYANIDSSVTVALHGVMKSMVDRKGLSALYEQRRKVLKVTYDVEKAGVTVSRKRLDEIDDEYTKASEERGRKCVSIAATYGHELTLPKSGNNKSLLEFAFEKMKLPVVGYTETGNASFDKEAVEKYLAMFDKGDPRYEFMAALSEKRKADTAIGFMAAYRRFWRNVSPGWCRLHPNLNQTGTYTTRWSSYNPNEQNISKKEGFNLRRVFGPGPGREQWSLDGKNMELRFPAYESDEEEMIALFERPDDPPYYGSNHMLVAHLLFPKEFERCIREGLSFKKEYDVFYDRVKRFDFCVQYGGQRELADATCRLPGAFDLVMGKFVKQAALSQHWVRFANKNGYVETIPDRTVDPTRGYPILSTRTEYGRIKPTVPFSNHIQGSVGWWMEKAMWRCHEFLHENFNRKLATGSRAGFYMVMQVHDELVFDFPRGTGPEPWRTNLPVIREIKRLMELGGDDLVMATYPDGIPTPVSVEYHAVSYDQGLTMTDEMLEWEPRKKEAASAKANHATPYVSVGNRGGIGGRPKRDRSGRGFARSAN